MAKSYFGNSDTIIIKNCLDNLAPHMSYIRLLFISQLHYNIQKPDKSISNVVFIMHKKAIRITRFLRKSTIDTCLETRPVWVSFFQRSFCFC